MAISRIGANTAAATTVTVAAHQIGDLILIFAYRNTTTAPTLPAGYTNISTATGNANSYRIGYKWATATNDTSGTWTSANELVSVVYRGVAAVGGVTAATKAAATTATIGAVTFVGANAKSWVVSFAGHLSTSTQGTPLAGTTNVVGTIAGTTSNLGVFDSNAEVGSFAATTSANGSSVASSGGAVELTAYGSASTLSDRFAATTLNTGIWFQFTGGSATMSYDGSGAQTDFPASSTAATDGDISTTVAYDWTGQSASLHVVSIPNTATAADALMNLTQIGGTGNGVRWVVESGTLFAQSLIAFTPTTQFSVTYSPITHAYWRIRESAGAIFWDTGVDNGDGTVTYTQRATVANPIHVTDLSALIAGACYQVETSPGTFKFNNFNTGPSGNPQRFFS